MQIPVPIRVLVEDPAILAIDKPVGVAAIPERDLTAPSVQRLLEAARGERLWVVHRLDKEVSGVLVFARTAEAHRALSIAFEKREVDKTYLALVHGVLAADSGTIAQPIHQFGSGRMGVDGRGKPSKTHYVVRARGATTTLVEARPVTGRRHQIRVHFYHLGHPIVGDPRYGERSPDAVGGGGGDKGLGRLMLHALRLVVPRPPGSPGEGPLTISAPADACFDQAIAADTAR